jgi:hypothetical protein
VARTGKHKTMAKGIIMEIDKHSHQIYEWMQSMHRMVLGLMLFIGLAVGVFFFYLTKQWAAIPICFVLSFVYPLGENIKRKVTHKNNDKSIE